MFTSGIIPHQSLYDYYWYMVFCRLELWICNGPLLLGAKSAQMDPKELVCFARSVRS